MTKRKKKVNINKPTKKQLEFSQRLVIMSLIFAMSIVFYAITVNAILLFLDKMSMSQETIQTISVFGGVVVAAGNLSYSALCGFRDNSKNKHGVTHAELGVNNIPQISKNDNVAIDIIPITDI